MTHEPQQTARAYVAAIEALSAQGELEHVRILARELLGHLEAAWTAQYTAPEHSKNSGKMMESSTIVQRDPKPEKRAKTAAERKRDQRARDRAARAATQSELALHDVTNGHAPNVTSVTAGVTRDVTSSSSSDLLSERPTKGLSGEQISESCCEPVTSRHAVTNVTVTPLELPESLSDELRGIFGKILAQRRGVEIDPDALWGKFRRKKREANERIVSAPELRFKWAFWCRNEEPDEETCPRAPESATDPTVMRKADADEAERSRRADIDHRERLASEAEQLRIANERAWGGARPDRDALDAQTALAFTPEAMEAELERRAREARKAS